MARAQSKSKASASSSRGREVAGIVLLGAALFVGLSVASLQLGSGTLMGPLGMWVGIGVYALVGVGAYLGAVGLVIGAVRCLRGQPVTWRSIETVASVTLALCLAILVHLAFGKYRLRGYGPGGLFGEYGGELLVSMVGRVGAGLVAMVGFLVSAVLATPLSVRGMGRVMADASEKIADATLSGVSVLFPEKGEKPPKIEKEKPEKERRARARSEREDETDAEQILEAEEAGAQLEEDKPQPKRRAKRRDDVEIVKIEDIAAPIVAAAAVAATGMEPIVLVDEAKLDAANEAKPDVKPVEEPKIVEPVAVKKTKQLELPQMPKPDFIPAEGGYHLPEISLLDYEDRGQSELDRNAMLSLAEKLEKTLADFGVKGRVVQIHPGPVVTMYEFVPVAGTKLTKITGLSNDLAMSLEALRVRIVAPIPGKGSVGIEVPNKSRATVFLKEILADENIAKQRAKLTMGLGKDIAGVPVAVDLAKMPHLLVAGTTGSGKSVAVNGMICSLLFNATPEEVRLLMIDPKMLELSIYDGIPHLLLPVVTDPKKANLALRWAVDEMERRYELISKSGVRDIVGYNKKMEKLISDGEQKPEEQKLKIYVEDESGDKREVEVAPDEDSVLAAGGVVTEEVRDEISAARAKAQKPEAPPPRKLPYIVVIIDEFADLMMVASKEVETSVARIAQKARAAGIHLLLATQRPSVDVITGLIKANFPSRIAFQVASKIDSRTILDQQGAEALLGQGDMLFTDRGQALKRIHGALVTEVEIKKLVDFLKEQGKPVYDMDILKPRSEEDGEDGMGGGEESRDEMYDMAVKIVTETRQASVSMIQRRLQVGYNRAARMVEQMEREGIVGAANGAKPREVLAQAI